MGWGDAEPFGVEGQRPMLDKMANERRRVITGMAALVAAPGLAMTTARRAQAQSQPDRRELTQNQRAHQRLGLEPAHVGRCLGLFEETVRDLCDGAAAAFFIDRAHHNAGQSADRPQHRTQSVAVSRCPCTSGLSRLELASPSEEKN